MTPNPGSLLPVAFQAAEIATGLMRTRRPASLTEKHDRDLVSDVDLAIERQVRTLLAEATSVKKKANRAGLPGGGCGRWTRSTGRLTSPTASRCARHRSPCSVTGARSWA